jgi:phosphorylcholine metabolism protein LicD
LSLEDIKDLKKGQKIMTSMLKEFDRICRKYNLKYWCDGGTLLGVIRHKGWIPFDGDIDVGMLETDYKKLEHVIQSELPNGMWFQSIKTDKYYKSDISKIRYLNSNYKDYKSQDWHNGIQLDIFIYKNNIIDNNEIKPAIIFPLGEAKFDNVKVFIPNDYDKYLNIAFSNYMEIPPIEKRIPHEGRIEFNIPQWVKDKYPELYK